MIVRRFLAVFLLAPLGLCGCGAVTTVKTAFEMPVAPTPSPQEIARAKNSHAFNSLSKAFGQLNSKTLQPFFGKSSGAKATIARASRQPSPFSSDPARSLVGDLSRGANLPLSPAPVAVSVAPLGAVTSTIPSFSAMGNTRTVNARQIKSERLSAGGAGATNAARAFLRSWEARESLRRADEELLGRRTLEDRIALQSLGTRPTVDLSRVSPETRLELSNLRLQLLPLLSVAPGKRAQATAQIEAIEARLKAIWEGETARQEALLRQSLVEVPARLRTEGESALATQTRADIIQTRTRLAKVQRDLEARLGTSRPITPLGIILRAATAPAPSAVGAALGSPVSSHGRQMSGIRIVPLASKTEIARRGAGVSSSVTRSIAEKNDRIWNVATR